MAVYELAISSYRCMECAATFTVDEMVGKTCCPSCRTTVPPMRIADDVTIKTNWAELQILAIWASNWAAPLAGTPPARALAALIERLEKSHPDRGPLVPSSAMTQLRHRIALVGADGMPIEVPK